MEISDCRLLELPIGGGGIDIVHTPAYQFGLPWNQIAELSVHLENLVASLTGPTQ